MFLKKIIFVCLFCCLTCNYVFALSENKDFLIIPSAEVLGDKAFQFRGTLGYHQSACVKNGSPNMCDRHPFVTSLRFGLFNSMELGVQFGNNISLDIKDRINKAYNFVPSIAIGARAFVKSSEAYFYSVPSYERKNQTGEFYAVAEWGTELWRILGGVSAFPLMEADDVAPFWGFEQRFGYLSFLYEGFFRHGFSHHNVGLAFKPTKMLQISVGASEFYRYFFNDDGDFKFRIKNPGAGSGYRSPGVYMSIAINGGFSEGIESSEIELDSIKKQLEIQSKYITDLHTRLDSLEMLYHSSDTTQKNNYFLNLQKEFDIIVQGYKSDDMNLDSLTEKEHLFMDKGLPAKRFIVRESKNQNATQDSRIVAIRVISHFPDSALIEHLGSIVADNSNERVAREAVLALGAINTPEARKVLSIVVNQTTSSLVRQTIIEIMGSL